MSRQKAGSADGDPCCGSPKVTEAQNRVTELMPWKGRARASQMVQELQVALITEPSKANVPEPSIIGSPE